MPKAYEHWLSLDLSSTCATLAIHKSQGKALTLVAEAIVSADFNHSERMLSSLDGELKNLGLTLSQFSRFITTSGPGSFTGLRIGFASMKAFAFATGKPIETISGAEARAIAHGNFAEGQRVVVATTVARDRYARAEFKMGKKLALVSESIVAEAGLTDPKVLLLRDEKTPVLSNSELFPLQAKHLGECLPTASSRKTHKTIAEWIAVSPEYFGDARFG